MCVCAAAVIIPLRPPSSSDQVNSRLLVWVQSQGWDVTICFTYRSVDIGASLADPEPFEFRPQQKRCAMIELQKCLGKCSLCGRYRATSSIKELGYRKAIWFRKQLRYPPTGHIVQLATPPIALRWKHWILASKRCAEYFIVVLVQGFQQIRLCTRNPCQPLLWTDLRTEPWLWVFMDWLRWPIFSLYIPQNVSGTQSTPSGDLRSSCRLYWQSPCFGNDKQHYNYIINFRGKVTLMASRILSHSTLYQ